mmetsp:Transcript_7401/g.18672  ORF Transcript_7401/g.18672 Transcript_7401/m.18672 type:complete len:247 (+) Transcript_7401:97-837(+)
MPAKNVGASVDVRDEAVRHLLEVLVPSRPILRAAPRLVSASAVRDHCHEEAEVDVGQGRGEPTTQTPEQGHGGVGGVVDLPSAGVPPVDEQHTGLTLDVLRVRHVPEGRKQVPVYQDLPALLHLEVALVVVRLVPNAVGEHDEHSDDGVVYHCRHTRWQNQARPRVLGKEEGLVAVQQRHACKIPPAEHPTELLRRDVPSVGNEVLPLGASIGVQAVRDKHEEGGVQPAAGAAVRLHIRPTGDEEE